MLHTVYMSKNTTPSERAYRRHRLAGGGWCFRSNHDPETIVLCKQYRWDAYEESKPVSLWYYGLVSRADFDAAAVKYNAESDPDQAEGDFSQWVDAHIPGGLGYKTLNEAETAGIQGAEES